MNGDERTGSKMPGMARLLVSCNWLNFMDTDVGAGASGLQWVFVGLSIEVCSTIAAKCRTAIRTVFTLEVVVGQKKRCRSNKHSLYIEGQRTQAGKQKGRTLRLHGVEWNLKSVCTGNWYMSFKRSDLSFFHAHGCTAEAGWQPAGAVPLVSSGCALQLSRRALHCLCSPGFPVADCGREWVGNNASDNLKSGPHVRGAVADKAAAG
eukprot:3337445-Pleurochrysis_carterae.AAC.14